MFIARGFLMDKRIEEKNAKVFPRETPATERQEELDTEVPQGIGSDAIDEDPRYANIACTD